MDEPHVVAVVDKDLLFPVETAKPRDIDNGKVRHASANLGPIL